jgi:hypothetical protein
MSTISGSPKPLWPAYRSLVLAALLGVPSTFAWTRAMMASPSSASLKGADTYATCLVAVKRKSRDEKGNERDGGLLNARTLGPTAAAACSCGGKRKRRITLRLSICSSLTSPYAPPVFWDRLLTYFHELKQVVAAAVQSGQGLLVTIE